MAICYQPSNILSPSSVIKKSLPKPSINVRWNSVEGCAMGKRVMVYKFTGWDTVSQRSMSLPVPIWGPADFIKERKHPPFVTHIDLQHLLCEGHNQEEER